MDVTVSTTTLTCEFSADPNSKPGVLPDAPARRRLQSVPYARGCEACAPITSNIVSFTRTAVEGAGVQLVTGMGFQPAAIWVNCNKQPPPGAEMLASWGFGDVGGNEAHVVLQADGLSSSSAQLIRIGDGVDEMVATLTSMDSDGFTLSWTEFGAGKDVECKAMGIR
jgi:hypothetical protein